MPKYIGLKDKSGKKICVGDKVRFYYDADRGYSEVPDLNYTTMVDKVIEDNGEFYFANHDVGWAAFAWRHNENCEVIGRWDE